MTELSDPKKSTHQYLNDGILAYDNITQKEQDASLGKRANNDPSEGTFPTFTDVLCNSNCISIDSPAGIGQARFNNNMNRGNHQQMVTRRKSNSHDDTPAGLGLFHRLPEKLQNPLLAVSKKNSVKSCKQFQKSLEEQQAQHAKKIELGIMQKFEAAE